MLTRGQLTVSGGRETKCVRYLIDFTGSPRRSAKISYERLTAGPATLERFTRSRPDLDRVTLTTRERDPIWPARSCGAARSCEWSRRLDGSRPSRGTKKVPVGPLSDARASLSPVRCGLAQYQCCSHNAQASAQSAEAERADGQLWPVRLGLSASSKLVAAARLRAFYVLGLSFLRLSLSFRCWCWLCCV